MADCTCGTLRLIGDVHGDYKALSALAGDHKNVIQIGDLGLGFTGPRDKKLNYHLKFKSRMRFFRGNHDNPSRCRAHPKHLRSGWHDEGFFVVGGGLSIDAAYRTEGKNWWSDEEHSARELATLVEEFADSKPRLVLSHEGPQAVTDAMFKPKRRFESATAEAMRRMWTRWQPDLWVFGHWHVCREFRMSATMFRCIGEKKSLDIHTPDCACFDYACLSQREKLVQRLCTQA
jgi:hypothetical protein